jgi:hypothetical protein
MSLVVSVFPSFRLNNKSISRVNLDTWTPGQNKLMKMQQKFSLISLFLTLQLDDAELQNKIILEQM